MCCPFLREATVKYCRTAPTTKALLGDAIDTDNDRCTRPEYASCPYAEVSLLNGSAEERCPSLAERRVQYCTAKSSPKFIPYAAVLPSRCETDAFRHCWLYLERAGRRPGGDATLSHVVSGAVEVVDDIVVPLCLEYLPNHLWLGRESDGTCTVGADAFLTRVIGNADRVTFMPSRPGSVPMAILTVADTELPITFPVPVDGVGINYTLLAAPERLSEDPYGSGWLFDGYWRASCNVTAPRPPRLRSGQEAVAWMRREVARLSEQIHEQLGQRKVGTLWAAADGGTFGSGLARILHREDTMRLFADFFPNPSTTWSARCDEA